MYFFSKTFLTNEEANEFMPLGKNAFKNKYKNKLNKYQITQVNSLREMAEFISKNPWTPHIFRGKKRRISEFEYTSIIVYDIDKKDVGTSVKIADKLRQLNASYILASTASHMKDPLIPREHLRLIIPLNHKIYKESEYHMVWEKVAKILGIESLVDPSCRDLARFYYQVKSIIGFSENCKNLTLYDVSPYYRDRSYNKLNRGNLWAKKLIIKLEKDCLAEAKEASSKLMHYLNFLAINGKDQRGKNYFYIRMENGSLFSYYHDLSKPLKALEHEHLNLCLEIYPNRYKTLENIKDKVYKKETSHRGDYKWRVIKFREEKSLPLKDLFIRLSLSDVPFPDFIMHLGRGYYDLVYRNISNAASRGMSNLIEYMDESKCGSYTIRYDNLQWEAMIKRLIGTHLSHEVHFPFGIINGLDVAASLSEEASYTLEGSYISSTKKYVELVYDRMNDEEGVKELLRIDGIIGSEQKNKLKPQNPLISATPLPFSSNQNRDKEDIKENAIYPQNGDRYKTIPEYINIEIKGKEAILLSMIKNQASHFKGFGLKLNSYKLASFLAFNLYRLNNGRLFIGVRGLASYFKTSPSRISSLLKVLIELKYLVCINKGSNTYGNVSSYIGGEALSQFKSCYLFDPDLGFYPEGTQNDGVLEDIRAACAVGMSKEDLFELIKKRISNRDAIDRKTEKEIIDAINDWYAKPFNKVGRRHNTIHKEKSKNPYTMPSYEHLKSA